MVMEIPYRKGVCNCHTNGIPHFLFILNCNYEISIFRNEIVINEIYMIRYEIIINVKLLTP